LGDGLVRIDLQFMKKKMVKLVKPTLFTAAFGEIGPQDGVSLFFVEHVHQADLGQAIDHLGGGDPQLGGPGAGGGGSGSGGGSK